MRGRLACALASVVGLAACGEDPGVYLTIQAKGVKQVAVYIGDSECTDSGGNPCGIAPMGGFDKIHPADPGGTWFRDSDRMFVAGVSNGQARVRIQPNGKGDTVQVIVLGLDDQGAPMLAKVIRDLKVPASDATSVAMTLDMAGAFDGKPHPSGTYVLRWQDPSAPTDCVLLEQWENGKAMDAFIVPEDDGDCDGVPTLDTSGQRNKNECDPYWFHFMDAIADNTANCAESMDQVAGHATCQLGGQACSDGAGVSGGCTRQGTTTCVPDAICNSACMNPGDTTPLSMCTPSAPVVHCVIYRDDGGSPCSGTFTAATHGTLDLAPLFPNPARSIAELDLAMTDSLYVTQLQQDKLLLPAPTPVELDFTKQSGTSYIYDVMWKDSTAFDPNALATEFGVVDIKVDNNNHMRLPLRVDFGSCTGTYTGPDGLICYAAVQLDNIKNCAM